FPRSVPSRQWQSPGPPTGKPAAMPMPRPWPPVAGRRAWLAYLFACRSPCSRVNREIVGIGGRIAAIPDHAVDQRGAAVLAGGQGRTAGLRRRFVDIDAVHLAGQRLVIGMRLEQPPALL